ncbi:MAG: hypothetical protein ACHREM_11380 [Polyangiales bacterium]
MKTACDYLGRVQASPVVIVVDAPRPIGMHAVPAGQPTGVYVCVLLASSMAASVYGAGADGSPVALSTIEHRIVQNFPLSSSTHWNGKVHSFEHASPNFVL